MTTKRIAKRKLTDVSFQHEGAHVALVSKEQGGSANGHPYALITKSLDKEIIEKMQQVKVTMELPDFLQKFFGVYYSDAQVLARMLGYVKPEDYSEDYYEEYIQEKLDSFEILKSMQDSTSHLDILAKLSGEEHLSLRKDQAILEKAFVDIEKNAVKKADTKKSKVKPSDSNKGKKMDENEVQALVLAEVQKAVTKQQEELTKALELVEVMKAEKKAVVEKARKDKITAVLKDAAKVEALFKALNLVDEAEFDAALKVVADLQATVEKSALFEEQGVQTETEPAEKQSGVATLLKSKYASKK